MNKKLRLFEKNIILTGAGGILGQKLSQAYLDEGANLALLDYDDNSLINLSKKLVMGKKNKFITYKTDLTSEKQVNSSIKSILKDFDSIDVLHNNAATKGSSLENFLNSFENYKLSTWNEIMNGNVNSIFLMCKAVGKIMVKQNSGSIIQTSYICLSGVTTP